MKKLVIIIILLFTSIKPFAQVTYKTIYQDTIHFRGIILDFKGNPVPGIILSSKNYDLNGKEAVYSKTDSLGKFELVGAKLNDTISVLGPTGFIIVYNRGSRFMEINLRAPYKQEITFSNPILITAVKKTEKKQIPVNIKISNDFWLDSGGPITGDHMAEFVGGSDKFVNYILKRLTYPQQAIVNNIEGMIEIGFSVYKDGSLNDFKIIRGLGYGRDEEVINILKTSPKWKPGIVNARPVISLETVSVQFKLTNK